MRLLKLFLIVILIVIPYPVGRFLIDRSFLSTPKPHLFRGDIPINEIPSDYCALNRGFFFEIPQGPLKERKMFYQDTRIGGPGLIKNTLLFVHGNLSSSYIYKDVIAQLEKKATAPARVIAMDLIGFGLSDRAPHPISPEEYAETLLALFRHLDLSDMFLVAHEWGGPLGIAALLHIPERVQGMLLINSSVFKGTAHENRLQAPKRRLFESYPISFFMPDMAWGKYVAYSVFSPASLSTLVKIDYIKNLILGRHLRTGGLPTEELRFYEHHLRSGENIRNAKHLLRNGRFFKDGKIHGPASPSLDALLGFIEKNMSGNWGPGGLNIAVSALFSGRDILSDPVVIDQWETALPQITGHVRTIEETGFFLQKERPEEVADAIIRMLSAINMAAAPPIEEISTITTPIKGVNEEVLNEE